MFDPLYLQFVLLLGGIVAIVVLTSRFKVHPFFALLIVSMSLGLSAGLSSVEVLQVMKDGFGQIMKSLGFMIVLGTTLGIVLERSGRTRVLASFIVNHVGSKRSALAMSLTGLIVGLPIFCDSGFIVLSGLNYSLAKQAGAKVITLAISLATGLYAVHCLVPPHPGAAAAAGILNVDFGQLMLLGIPVAIIPMYVGYRWALFAGNKIKEEHVVNPREEEKSLITPSVTTSIFPILIPIILIALKSIWITLHPQQNFWTNVISFVGEPTIALLVGVLLCLTNLQTMEVKKVPSMLQEAVEKSGSILVIIGAGGAFGHILGALNIGEHISQVVPLETMGILFPFLLTSILKTAQGSSTVAIITSASIIQPLLPALGLETETEKILCLLSMGGGSMMISHANDAYFWVISKFENVPMENMLKVYSVATIWMGLSTLLIVYFLSMVV